MSLFTRIKPMEAGGAGELGGSVAKTQLVISFDDDSLTTTKSSRGGGAGTVWDHMAAVLKPEATQQEVYDTSGQVMAGGL